MDSLTFEPEFETVIDLQNLHVAAAKRLVAEPADLARESAPRLIRSRC